MNETTALTILFIIRLVVPFVILMSVGEIARLSERREWKHRF